MLGRGMPRSTPAQTLDALLMEERKSLVNSPEAEMLARQWLANRMALEECSKREHIERPKNASQEWKTKFNWELYNRINPRGKGVAGLRNRALEGEINSARAQDATFENLKNRVDAQLASMDLVNAAIS